MTASMQLELLDQAEASVLGAALQTDAAAAQLAARVDEPDFRRSAHQLIFRAIVACARQQRFGTVEVTSWLIDQPGDLIGQVGGPAAVSQLAGRNVSAGQFGDRLGRVESARRRRLLHEGGNKIAAAARDWQIGDADLSRLAVDTVLQTETSADTGQVVRLADRRAEVFGLMQSGNPSRAVSTGWRTMDRHYMPAPGRWTLVGGIPGHGKSSWLDALVWQLGELHGWRTLVCSPEKQPLEVHMAQLIQMAAGRPLLGRAAAGMGDDVDAAADLVDGRFSWIELDEHGRDVGSLLALARLEHSRRPFHGLIIDPWNELDHSRDRNLSETEHISQSLTRIREFARRLDVHVWVVAHPTKMPRQVDGSYPVPTPYDVSGSAHWRNKADNAVAVWRDVAQPGSPSQVHVQKVRFQPHEGREGVVELTFDPSTGRFGEGSPV